MKQGTAADDSSEKFLRSNSPSDETTTTPTREMNAIDGRTSHFSNDLWLLISVVTYAAEIGTAVCVAVKYYKSGEIWWFGLTLGFLILASLTMQIFSLRWFFEDGKANRSVIYVFHLLQLGPLMRYWNTLRSSWRCRRKGCSKNKYLNFLVEWRDVTMLRLFQSFLLSAPQMVLQLYVMVTHRNFNSPVDLLTAVSAGCSTLSLIWTLVTHSKVLREFRRANSSLSFTGFLLQVLWRTCMVTSRVVALVLFASHFAKWILAAVAVHWLIMTLWLIGQRNKFCTDERGKDHPLREKLFNFVIGFIYIFCFFNVKEGTTRMRLVVFYSLMLVENSLLVAMWYPNRTFQGMAVFAALISVWGGFAFGILCMILYYYFYHPSLPVQGMCVRKRKFDVEGRRGYSLVVCCCCLFKTRQTAYGECVQSNNEVVVKGVHRAAPSPPFELEILPRVASRDLYREGCEVGSSLGSRAEILVHSTPRKTTNPRHPLVFNEVPDVLEMTATSQTFSPRHSISNSSLVARSDLELEFDNAGHFGRPLVCTTLVWNEKDTYPEQNTNANNDRITPTEWPEGSLCVVPLSTEEKVDNFNEDKIGEATGKEEAEADVPQINYGSLSFGHRYSLVSSDCISLSSESSRSSLDSIIFENEGKSAVRIQVGDESEVALTPRTADEGIYSDDRCSTGVQRASSHSLPVPSLNSVLSSPDDENLGYLEYLMDASSPRQVRAQQRTSESASEKEDGAESESDWHTDASSDTGPMHCSLEEIVEEENGSFPGLRSPSGAVAPKRHTFDFSDLSASKRGNRRRHPRSKMRRFKRKEFDNFVVTHLKPGKYGSLRRSCERLAKIQEDSEEVFVLQDVSVIPEVPSPRLTTPELNNRSSSDSLTRNNEPEEVPVMVEVSSGDINGVLRDAFVEGKKIEEVSDSDKECTPLNQDDIPDDESSSSQSSPVSKVSVERAKAAFVKRRRLKKFLSKGFTPGKFSSVRCSYERIPINTHGPESHNGDPNEGSAVDFKPGLPGNHPNSHQPIFPATENVLRILAATGRASEHFKPKLLENGISEEVNCRHPSSGSSSTTSPEKRHTYDFSRLSIEHSTTKTNGSTADPLLTPRSPVWVHQPLPFSRRNRRPRSAVLHVK